MNNEPVAWMYNYENFPDSFVVCRARKSDQDIPLYTHPAEHDLGIAEAIGFEKGHISATAMIHEQQAEMEELKAAVRSFFNDYLDQREESDSGRVFAPIYISNCRCMTLDPMSKLMSKMRELSGAKPPPKGDW